MPKVDLTGKVFGRLTVLGPGEKDRYWRCKCECGREKEIFAGSLTSGNSKSCRCLRTEKTVARNTKHGQAKNTNRTSTWQCWWRIKARIDYSSNPNYSRYGGRGIRMCGHWRIFINFLADVGEKPGKEFSIDRIDVNGHYSCGKCEECVANGWQANCRWLNSKDQARNKRDNHNLTHDGQTMCISAWAEKTGIQQASILWRVKNGWSVEDALTVPANKYTKKSKTEPNQDQPKDESESPPIGE